MLVASHNGDLALSCGVKQGCSRGSGGGGENRGVVGAAATAAVFDSMKALLRDTMPRPAFFAAFFGIGLVVALLSLFCHAPLPLPLPRAPRFAENMRTREGQLEDLLISD